jgi:hypothetical protein
LAFTEQTCGRLQLVRIKEGKDCVQGLGGLCGKGTHLFAQLGRKFLCAFGQLGELELVLPCLKRNFPTIGIEADGVYVCQPPLEALGRDRQDSQVCLEQPNFG